MSDLTTFLLARIAEDEEIASRAGTFEPWSEKMRRDNYGHLNVQPDRVLAECDAKRRIVDLHPTYRGSRIQPIDTTGTDFGCALCHRLDALHSDSLIEAIGYCDTLLSLALPYADHPDYDEAWRP